MGFLLNCDTSLGIDSLADLGGIVGNIPVSVQMLLQTHAGPREEKRRVVQRKSFRLGSRAVCFNAGVIPHKLEHALTP